MSDGNVGLPPGQDPTIPSIPGSDGDTPPVTSTTDTGPVTPGDTIGAAEAGSDLDVNANQARTLTFTQQDWEAMLQLVQDYVPGQNPGDLALLALGVPGNSLELDDAQVHEFFTMLFNTLVEQSPHLTHSASQGDPLAILMLSRSAGLNVGVVLEALKVGSKEDPAYADEKPPMERLMDELAKLMMLKIMNDMLQAMLEGMGNLGAPPPSPAKAAVAGAQAAFQAAKDEALLDDLAEEAVQDALLSGEITEDQVEDFRMLVRNLVQQQLCEMALAFLDSVPQEVITEEKLSGFAGEVGGKLDVLREELAEWLGNHPEDAQMLRNLEEYMVNGSEIGHMAERITAASLTLMGGAGGDTVNLPIVA